MRNITDRGLALIKSFEGFRSYPYRDAAGVRTIGYGHTEGVTAYSTPVTPAQAEELLKSDVTHAAAWVERFVTSPLNDNQFSALVALVFNAGTAPLEGTLGRLLNSGDYAGAASEFSKWVHAGGVVLNGLIKRRRAERELFLAPVAP